jgi:hypothetical protein
MRRTGKNIELPYPLPTLVALDGQSATGTTQDKRVWTFPKIASDFAAGMKKAAWQPAFVKVDDQWSATDIKKSSLGGNSIFNTCNFGLLMTHGSYATTAEDDNVKYTYVWLGANNYVRLSDMDFGSDGTNGLRWMTILACNILRSANYNSMNNNFKIPVNDSLHLLLGPSTTSYACEQFGVQYGNNLTRNNETIINSFNNAGSYAHALDHAPTAVSYAVSGWSSCFGDTLTSYSDPDDETLQYQQTPIYTP